jgi:phosphatidate cytidylyltransferase
MYLLSNTLFLRILSSLVLIPVVMAAIISGGWFFALFVAVAFGLTCAEWVQLTRNSNRSLFYLLLGLVYFSISYLQFEYLRLFIENGVYLTLVCMFMIWGSDTGAYIFGKKIGGALMSPTISPKKTWSGMIGAMIGSSFIFTISLYAAPYLTHLIPNTLNPTISQLPFLIILSLMMGYVGQIGDLLMSAMKRKACVKDSSQLIPGHGGILDRIDSLLLVIPVFVIVARYVLN